MTSFLLRCAIFAALLVSVLQLVELAVPFYWGNSGFATKMAYLKESELRYDTLLVGSSRIFRQADPSIFDAATGRLTNTFNLGVSATYNPEIYYLYEHLLDDDISSDVKFVLMELQSLNRIASRNVATRAAIYSVDRKTCRFAVSTLSEVEVRPVKRAEAVGRYRASYLQRFFKIHILREILEFRFSPARSDSVLGPNRDGFYALELQVEEAPGRSQAKIALRAALVRSPELIEQRRKRAARIYRDPESWTFSETHLRRLEHIIERSRARGIEIRFVLPPRLPFAELAELLPIYERLDEDLTIDLADPRAHPEFYEMDYSFDVGHLNTRGAEHFTRLLAERFLASRDD